MSADTAIQMPALAFPHVSPVALERPVYPESLAQDNPPDSPPNSKKRKRPMRSEPKRNVKRALSSPQLPKPSTISNAPISSPEDDKKRNKLGYHRTSVACGHCRRRKIRCLIPPDESSGRCRNCIRLKKDCNFFPVEQSPSMEKRPDQTGKTDPSKRTQTSLSSPPLLPRPDALPVTMEQYVFPPSATSATSPAFQFTSDHHNSLGIFTSKDPELPDPPIYSHTFDTSPTWEGLGYSHGPPMSAINSEPLTAVTVNGSNAGGSSYQHLLHQSNPAYITSALVNESPISHDRHGLHQHGPSWMTHPARSFSYSGAEHAPRTYSPLPPSSGHEETLRRASTLPIPYQGTFGYGGDTTPSLTEEGSFPYSAPAGSYSTPQSYQWPPSWNAFDPTTSEHYATGGKHQAAYSSSETTKAQEAPIVYDNSWYHEGPEDF